MKKFLVILSLSLLWCNNTFAEMYYFKQCKINNVVTANYIINIEKNVIGVELKSVDGTVQNFFDEIIHKISSLENRQTSLWIFQTINLSFLSE